MFTSPSARPSSLSITVSSIGSSNGNTMSPEQEPKRLSPAPSPSSSRRTSQQVTDRPQISTERTTIFKNNETGTASKRRIGFDPNARIYLVPTVSELTPEEKEQLWITPTDEEESREAVVSNVVTMRNFIKDGFTPTEILTSGIDDDSSTICFRGLEHMVTTEHSKKKKIRRRRVTLAVLDEQDRQEHVGERDDVLLADASALASSYARRIAVDLAAKDARYVVNHVLPTIRRRLSSVTTSSNTVSASNNRPKSRSRNINARPQASVAENQALDVADDAVPSSSSVVSTDSDDISQELVESSNSSKHIHRSRLTHGRKSHDGPIQNNNSSTADLHNRPSRSGGSPGDINLLVNDDEMKDDVVSVLSSFAKARLSKMLGKPTPPSSLYEHQRCNSNHSATATARAASADGSPNRKAAQTA